MEGSAASSKRIPCFKHSFRGYIIDLDTSQDEKEGWVKAESGMVIDKRKGGNRGKDTLPSHYSSGNTSCQAAMIECFPGTDSGDDLLRTFFLATIDKITALCHLYISPFL